MCIKRYALDRRVTSVQDKLYTRVVFLARHRSLPGLEIRGHCRYRPNARALSRRAAGPEEMAPDPRFVVFGFQANCTCLTRRRLGPEFCKGQLLDHPVLERPRTEQ